MANHKPHHAVEIGKPITTETNRDEMTCNCCSASSPTARSCLASLVLGTAAPSGVVCRRVLHHEQDPRSFQAVFLILARKAASIRKGKPWAAGCMVSPTELHESQQTASRRQEFENQATGPAGASADQRSSLRDYSS